MGSSDKDKFRSKLMVVLKKITRSQCKILDNIYLEKLLSNFKSEFDDDHENYINLPELSEWLMETLKNLRENHESTCLAKFMYEFIGILSRKEEGFNFLQKINAFNDLIDILQDDVLNVTVLKEVHIKLLSDLLSHNAGFEWIKASQQWKVIIKVCLKNSNFYVEKEGLTFIKKYISRIKSDDILIEEILQEILLPISRREEITIKNKASYLETGVSLKLLETVLEVFVLSKENTICEIILKIFNLETFLVYVLENYYEKAILDAASTVYVLFLVIRLDNKKVLLQHIPAKILEVFSILVRRNLIESIIKLSKFCLLLWSEIKNEFQCSSSTVVQFIILQLVPVLMYNKNQPQPTKLFDLYIQKLFELTSDNVQKFGYSLRDAIRSTTDSKLRDCAVKGVLSVIGNMETLSLNEAVIIFQALAYALKVFVPECECDKQWTTNNTHEKEKLLYVVDASLLSTVLNALCILIEKFKINWTESLESLCLLKMTCRLLQITELSSILVVQTLLLVKLAILNFMSPNLALLLNKSEDSSFESLMTLLYIRMQDPNWEVRDSCIEVITTIAELAESKFPAFQRLLIEKDVGSLVFDIMQSDSESYVRASALRALASMTKLETLNESFSKLDLPSKIIKIMETESEGIVRREAALLIKQIYLVHRDPSDFLNSFYHIMSYSAICDLHWEVKVNSLLFWEAVIQRIITDQGMIDGSFPKVTFSKENKKIVTLTSDEIKMRLHKVLKELSEIGCLYVLLSALNDDCDFQVAHKSAQILTDFLSILKRYDVMTPCRNLPVCERVPMKRKYTECSNCEKRKPFTLALDTDELFSEIIPKNVVQQPPDSDEIIEEIVNEMDINLLVSVCQPKEEKSTSKKKVLLQEVKPEAFLLQMQSFDSEKFLQDKQRWFMNVEFDLKSLVNEIITLDTVSDTNIMDCY